MDHGAFRGFKHALDRVGAYRRRPGETYSDGAVLAVHFWATLRRIPVSRACLRENLPRGLWRGPLPDQSTVSRRMRRPGMRALMERVQALLARPAPHPPLVAAVDGKPVEVAGHSADRTATRGRAAGRMGRGYKLHAVVDGGGALWCWRLSGLDRDERVIARRLVRDMPQACYLVGDANYDSNPLHRRAAARGIQVVAPRKRSHAGKGLGAREHEPGRLRSVAMLEPEPGPFARGLLGARSSVERLFANLSNAAGGLDRLPPWVRTYRRVHAHVQAVIVAAILKGSIKAARPGWDA